MRDIKFRVWDKHHNQMVYMVDGVSLIIREGNWFVEKYYHKHITFKADGILMQFTGLKDKNGKEIYEGDIVKFYTYNHKKGKIAVVEYVDGAFLPFHDNEYIQDEQGDWFHDWKGFEIIGNIYEHAHLLEEVK